MTAAWSLEYMNECTYHPNRALPMEVSAPPNIYSQFCNNLAWFGSCLHIQIRVSQGNWAASWQNQQNGMCAQRRQLQIQFLVILLLIDYTHELRNKMVWFYPFIQCHIGSCWIFEPRYDKTNKMTVRPAKTQISLGIRPVWSEWISLGIRPVWSESSLCA